MVTPLCKWQNIPIPEAHVWRRSILIVQIRENLLIATIYSIPSAPVNSPAVACPVLALRVIFLKWRTYPELSFRDIILRQKHNAVAALRVTFLQKHNAVAPLRIIWNEIFGVIALYTASFLMDINISSDVIR